MTQRWKWGVKDGIRRLYDERGNAIATGEYKRGVIVQRAVNSRLIEAAPELFDLLERLIAEDALSASNTAEAAILLARIEHGEEP